MSNRATSIRGDLIAEYVEELVAVGTVTPDKQQKSRLRHFEKGQHTSFWGLDEFLTGLELHVDLFLLWCEVRGVSPWVQYPPGWWERIAA